MNRTHVAAIISTSLFALLIPLLTNAAGFCPHLTQNLHFGDHDATTNGQVTELQHFLSDYYSINPSDIITGGFWYLTQQYVMQFQHEQGITPVSGFVGSLTRARIAHVCGTQTTPPPPPAPTCTLNAYPSSITLDHSSFLVWHSTDATHAEITHLGSVPIAGAEHVSPTETTTYTGTFTGHGGRSTCATTITVTPLHTDASSTDPHAVTCSKNGITYPLWTILDGLTCHSDGQWHDDAHATSADHACTWNGHTIDSSHSVTAYHDQSVPHGHQCVAETRICFNGTLTGSYQYEHCAVLTAAAADQASQLAAALIALESALKALLQLLK